MPLKRFIRPMVWSTTGMSASVLRCRTAARDRFLHRADPTAQRLAPCADALATDQHDDHQYEADPERPVLGPKREKKVLHEFEDDRADDAPIQPSGAAEDENEQQIGRAVEGENFERCKSRRLRKQSAGNARIERRDRVA